MTNCDNPKLHCDSSNLNHVFPYIWNWFWKVDNPFDLVILINKYKSKLYFAFVDLYALLKMLKPMSYWSSTGSAVLLEAIIMSLCSACVSVAVNQTSHYHQQDAWVHLAVQNAHRW